MYTQNDMILVSNWSDIDQWQERACDWLSEDLPVIYIKWNICVSIICGNTVIESDWGKLEN